MSSLKTSALLILLGTMVISTVNARVIDPEAIRQGNLDETNRIHPQHLLLTAAALPGIGLSLATTGLCWNTFFSK
jgi:hypothetical protein